MTIFKKCYFCALYSFVFEGKAPDLKREELAKRSARREGATAELEQAKEVSFQKPPFL